MSDRDLSKNERKAWREVTKNVQRLDGRAARAPGSKRVAGSGQSSPLSTRPQSPAPSPPENRQSSKEVRRGQQRVSATLDLHGYTQDKAWSLLPSFLRSQQSQGAKCVLIITGKGADGQGVLRQNFLQWLEIPEAAHLVSGYAQAHPRHGGAGAWYVYVRRR